MARAYRLAAVQLRRRMDHADAVASMGCAAIVVLIFLVAIS